MTMQIDDDFPLMMETEVNQQTGSVDPRCPPVQVSFGLYPMKDEKKSKEANHDVFKDVEFVKIVIPGDRSSLYFQPASETHKRRFPRAYASFKDRKGVVREGMAIEEWPVISRSLALTLRALNVHTVEALSAVHDGLVDRIGANGRELRAKAQTWLDTAKDNAVAMKAVSEKEDLQRQLAALQAQITALGGGEKLPEGAVIVDKAPPLGYATPDHTDDVEKDVAAAARKPRGGKGKKAA
jgi:hypothetical protein